MCVSKCSFLTVLLLFALLVGACQPVQAPQAAQPTMEIGEAPGRILFIGDSFSMFLEDYFPGLTASTDPPTIVENGLIWIGGAPLSLHWSMPSTLTEIETGEWDVVVLQEDVVENWYRVDEFADYARQFHEKIQQAGAETILYMHWPWAHQADPGIDQIAKTFGDVGTALGVKVAPVGLAWQRAVEERPDLDLYASDRVHANTYGAYLAMCVLYATIFDRSPVGATYRLEDAAPYDYAWSLPMDWKLSDEDAEFLQRIAWETVVDYPAQRQAAPAP